MPHVEQEEDFHKTNVHGPTLHFLINSLLHPNCFFPPPYSIFKVKFHQLLAVPCSWQPSARLLELQTRLHKRPLTRLLAFPGGTRGKEPTCQCRRCQFSPWVGKIPWRRAWQSTPVFLPGKSPWPEEPGWLQSMGSQSVGHD